LAASLLLDERGDTIARDHEKNVNPDERGNSARSGIERMTAWIRDGPSRDFAFAAALVLVLP